MYNAKKILSFCAKVRRFSCTTAMKVVSVERFPLSIGEAVTLCIEASRLAFSMATIYNALKQVGIHLHDVVVIYDTNALRVWRVTFLMCKTGTGSKLKSFFKL